MSREHSASASTHAPSVTLVRRRQNEPSIDPSNVLYNDKHNYQTIFSNDSRFFDTSLHLFKSYSNLGYITVNQKKPRRPVSASSSSASQSQTDRFRNQWRRYRPGFNSSQDTNGSTNGTLRPPLPKPADYSISQRSDPGASRIKQENSQMSTSHERQSMLSPSYTRSNADDDDDDDDDDSDDPDIIITRL